MIGQALLYGLVFAALIGLPLLVNSSLTGDPFQDPRSCGEAIRVLHQNEPIPNLAVHFGEAVRPTDNNGLSTMPFCLQNLVARFTFQATEYAFAVPKGHSIEVSV